MGRRDFLNEKERWFLSLSNGRKETAVIPRYTFSSYNNHDETDFGLATREKEKPETLC